MISSLLEKLVLGKKINHQNKEKLRIVVLCDLECQAIVPLLNYEFSAWHYFADFFELHYSDYQSFLTIYEQEIRDFKADVFFIIQEDTYYLDEYRVVLPIEQVKENVDLLKQKARYIIDKINNISSQSIIIATNLPYNSLYIKQYIGLKHREEFHQIVRDFSKFIVDLGKNSHLLEVASYNGKVIEHIYENHNSVASLEYLNFVSIECSKILRVLFGKAIKCVITDLDNTLWDGVIADTPVDDIFKSKKAHYFLAYQKWLSFLYQQGIILCIASKNDEPFVREIFEKYKDMLQVQWDQFVGKAINWENKSSNIKYLCKFLNINEEHVLFIDDSRYECEEVKFNLPKITVFQFSEDMQTNINNLLEADYFRKEQITETDYLRNKTYEENIKREAFKKSLANSDEFLKKLKITLSFTDQVDVHLERISDLSLRTNQFNLTTKRMDYAEVKTFLSDPANKIIVYSCADSFGDYGIIGCSFLSLNEDICKIHNLIMSCRVFGRQVEYALMNVIMHMAQKHHSKKIIGEYQETVKNKKFASFYQECGFVQGEGNNLYEFRFGEHFFQNKHPYVHILFE